MGEARLVLCQGLQWYWHKGQTIYPCAPTLFFANRLVSLTSADCLLLYQQGIQGYTRVYKGIQGYTRVYKGIQGPGSLVIIASDKRRTH